MRLMSFSIAVGLLALSAASASAQSANKVGVMVSGLRSDAGVVRCGLYANSAGFPQAGREARGTVARISGNRATCVFNNMPPGTYAVAAFHAEQNEMRMQYGAFGKPKQGYGFSGNPSSSFGAPTFSAASFDYRGGPQALQVRLQY